MTLNEPAGPEAFGILLHSEDTADVCRALDDYQHEEALTRFGGSNPLEPFADEVLFVARDLLGRPAGPQAHTSALNVLRNLAEHEDADLIAAALDGDPGVDLLAAGLSAAGAALTDGPEPNRRLLATVIAIVLDEGRDVDERCAALSALDCVEAPEVEDALIRASESGELDLEISAALRLARPGRIRTHRERVERLLASWPEDARGTSLVREQLAGFHSLHWTDAEPAGPELRSALEELMFPAGDEACLEAFLTLLRSDDPVAVGIAFDQYEHWEGLRRVLTDESSAERHLPEVLARAREELRRPPSPAELAPACGVGANHVSALNLIGARYATPSDADLVVEHLTRAASDQVRDRAIWVAYGVLDEAEVKDQRVIDALSGLLTPPWPRFSLEREQAIRVLADALGPQADDVLLRLVRGDDTRAQAHAVYYLLRTGGRDRYGDLLVEVAESWGEHSPARPWGEDVAGLVLGKLHSVYWEGLRLADPGLHRAHRELRVPTSEAACHHALRTLLDSGDQVAVGIALDHWWHPDGIARHFGEEARNADAPLVLDRVREALRQPRLCDSHLSALNALRVSWADEADLLADVLENAANDQIRECALEAVPSEDPGPRLVEALGNVACDPGVRLGDRLGAVRALDGVPGSAAALVRATGCPEVEIQAAAAWGLCDEEIFDEHRDLCERLSAKWPADNVPWEAERVRELL
ncbi:hypothetical protein SAMN05444920_10263 [Nonomuraea solani]|uniref:Uncharacterized protein n=1 Tax=Nonomuraea solani TaxID=1144553 RepID=A0A1H5XXL1_9ACTN|nr:hypothetical protein [Nonomuraea solani]SEG16514.1 hypothetical protein SAMN05444920_10263 [Nonomuraea solani]